MGKTALRGQVSQKTESSRVSHDTSLALESTQPKASWGQVTRGWPPSLDWHLHCSDIHLRPLPCSWPWVWTGDPKGQAHYLPGVYSLLGGGITLRAGLEEYTAPCLWQRRREFSACWIGFLAQRCLTHSHVHVHFHALLLTTLWCRHV